MLYVRLYVFGDILYTIYFYITWEWKVIVTFLFLFLTFLYMMHINWCILLLSKAYQLVIGKKLTDTVEFDKATKKIDETSKDKQN